MKTILEILAWIGLAIVGLSIPVAYSAGGFRVDMYTMGLGFAMLIGLAGALLFLLGGLITKPPFLWIAAIIVGVAYIAVQVRAWVPHETAIRSLGWLDWQSCIAFATPGLLSIAGGVWIHSRKSEGNNS